MIRCALKHNLIKVHVVKQLSKLSKSSVAQLNAGIRHLSNYISCELKLTAV